MNEPLEEWMEEVKGYSDALDVTHEGEHLWDNYQHVVAIMLRVQDIRNRIAWLELNNQVDPRVKKFRTTILDPFLDTLGKIAAFESRKISAKEIEAKMER